MKVYTTYFAQLRNLPEDAKVIAICRFTPNWYDGLSLPEVAPTETMVIQTKNGILNRANYLVQYNHILSQYTQKEVYDAFVEDAEGDVYLLCYEKCAGEVNENYEDVEKNFCHRHVLAEWLRAGGYDVTEWQPPEKMVLIRRCVGTRPIVKPNFDRDIEDVFAYLIVPESEYDKTLDKKIAGPTRDLTKLEEEKKEAEYYEAMSEVPRY